MSNIKIGQPCPKMAKIEEFKSSLRQGTIKIGAPLEIAQKPCGDNGAVIIINSASQTGEKFSVTINWCGGDSKAWAKFKNLAIREPHERLEEVLDFVRNKVFDLAMAISIDNLVIKPKEDSGIDPENKEVFEVTNYRFTAEQFQEELKIWNVQSEVIDGQLWIKEKDNAVAYMAATDLDKKLQSEEEE